ncbi:MAG: ThiS family protein [Methanobacterium sp. PtaU1.Bin097]|jgi:molybdopterin synthase sulfur carrier subunit|nr:MAG: ThiS family protein [Methanobacterium sp. PtaU1.Bin097]
MVNIKFLARFKEITGEKTLEIDYTGNLSGLIDLLINKYGNAFKEALLAKNGEFKDYIKILVNGEDANSLESEDTIGGDDEIVIFQTIAGG